MLLRNRAGTGMSIAFGSDDSVMSSVSGVGTEAKMLRIKEHDKDCCLSPSIHFPFFDGNGAPNFWLGS